MRGRIRTGIGWLLGLLLGMGTEGGTLLAQPPLPDWVQDLEAHYQQLQGLQARFRQVTDVPGIGRKEYRGILYLQRPDRIRWDYQEPFPQQAYLERDRLTLYNPQERQVFIRKIDPQEGLALVTTLLARAGTWQEWFDLHPQPPGDGMVGILDLLPRDPSILPPIRIWVDRRRVQIQALAWTTETGPRVRVEFQEIRENPAFPAHWFTFSPPPGVEILDWGS